MPADVVVPVPDSACRRRSAMPPRPAFPSSSASSATTMSAAPSSSRRDHIRHLGVKLKHNANRASIEGKRVILVDDCIVRGTTSSRRSSRWCAAPARARCICASPARRPPHSCFYGIDTPERSQLLAVEHDTEEMAKIIGVDSLAFISIDGLYRAMGEPGRDRAPAAILRRLLHRRLPDPADRPGRRRAGAALPARRDRLRPWPKDGSPGASRS